MEDCLAVLFLIFLVIGFFVLPLIDHECSDWEQKRKEATMSNTVDQPRKINLPEYCCGLTGWSEGGSEECDHDYPPESKDEKCEYVCWTCSKCGMRRCYEVFQ